MAGNWVTSPPKGAAPALPAADPTTSVTARVDVGVLGVEGVSAEAVCLAEVDAGSGGRVVREHVLPNGCRPKVLVSDAERGVAQVICLERRRHRTVHSLPGVSVDSYEFSAEPRDGIPVRHLSGPDATFSFGPLPPSEDVLEVVCPVLGVDALLGAIAKLDEATLRRSSSIGLEDQVPSVHVTPAWQPDCRLMRASPHPHPAPPFLDREGRGRRRDQV